MGKNINRGYMLCYALIKSKKWRKPVMDGSADFKKCGEYNGMTVSGDTVTFDLTDSYVKIRVLTSRMIKVTMVPKGGIEKDSPAIYKKEWDKVCFNVTEVEGYVKIKTSSVEVSVWKRDFNISFRDDDGIIDQDYEGYGMGYCGSGVCCYKAVDGDRHFYGFGEKTGPLNKMGWDTINWNTDEPEKHDDTTKSLYVSIPFYVGLNGKRAYGIYFDNTYKTCFNMGKDNKAYSNFASEGGMLTYYFIYGPQIKDVVEGYTCLTGRMKMPPLWALGYQQCRWSYYPEEKVLEIAQNFRERDIPCDVIYLDIDYMDGFRVFTHDNRRFPDFKGMIQKLHGMGFKVVTIIDPGVKIDKNYDVYREGIEKGYFTKDSSGSPFKGKVWPMDSVFPDFSKREVRDWWGDLNGRLFKDGVDGIWNDMNEPSVFDTDSKTVSEDAVHDGDGYPMSHKEFHNLYGMMMDEGTYRGFLRNKENTRPFLLTRSGFAGIQRYSAIWTGDNMSLWEHLKLSIPMNCNLGLSGVAFIGNDVGGFNKDTTGELLTRWMEVGAFLPFFRNHSTVMTKNQEPWAFGSEVEDICRKYIKLRYAILPYLYNLFYESYKDGHPIIRPMVYEYQGNEKTHTIDDQFMFGEAFLVAPVMNSGSIEREVYLPHGRWVDFWKGKSYEGGCSIRVDAPIDHLPLFVKSGSIIPMWDSMSHTGEREDVALALNVFGGENAEYTYYEDDGATLGYEGGIYNLTKFEYTACDSGFDFNINSIHHAYNGTKGYVINIVSCFNPSNVSAVIDGCEGRVEYMHDGNNLKITVPKCDSISLKVVK
jgi:Alpha-glucosidases, family 31 of glycosyl hydrolases